MSVAKQFGALLRMNLASIPQRLGLVGTIVVGVTCAVGVLVSMLAMGAGARQEAMGNVRPDRAILTTLDAALPTLSSIPKDTAALIRALPGIRRNAKGEPIAVTESLLAIAAISKADGQQATLQITGVSLELTDYAPELHLTSGRMFRPGLRELIASNTCVRQFADFATGDKRRLRGGEWLVVGNFDLGRVEGVCTVYADADTILSSVGRTTYNEVNVMLQSPAALRDLVSALNANPSLGVRARYEAQVVEEEVQQVNGILNFISYFVGGIMALAATIGAANSLYAIVDSRRLELATLRALGFGGTSIVISVLSEAILLAVPGALIGALLAWSLFNGLQASPLGTTIHLAVTASIAYLGVGWALSIGVLSGFLPALRAARVPVAVALQAI
ncbi:MAG TPA: ABC transporter permease [Steroidobacteraceae bacterium]|jgi:putative ABC transport system permease protein|nr:ABC transporter permease [Steroidobacteraceae bacterium]